MINKIIEHIIKVYEFELTSSSIPRSGLQSFKMNLYLFIKHRISQKLFLFIRDKISPIKYKIERPGGDIWLRTRLRDEIGGLCEVRICPIPPEIAIYSTNNKGIFITQSDGNYKVKIFYHTAYPYYTNDFNINLITGIQSIDAHFVDIPELKEQLRDYKLNLLMNNE